MQAKRKIIVLIPTRDRPQYLNLTVKSVAEQAVKHGHDVEIVVSDTSQERNLFVRKANAKINEELLRKLERRFGIPIHYYAPGKTRPIRTVLRQASKEESAAFKRNIPLDGEYGAHRNRLALLAVYHGGRDAVYLHLDDDTPLMTIHKGNLKPNPEDVLTLFIAGLENARKHGVNGYSGMVIGTDDVAPRNRKLGGLKEVLRHPTPIWFSGAGPGRILPFESMKHPYLPRGLNEDLVHSQQIGLDQLTALLDRWREAMPFVVHIGERGSTKRPPQLISERLEEAVKWFVRSESRIDELRKGWDTLVEKMAGMKERERG